MQRLMFAAALLCACASRSGPPIPQVDPHVAAAGVIDGVLAAASPDAEDAVALWREAHAAFEAHIEAPLRNRYGDHTAIEVEYRFGLVRSQLGTSKAKETARQLGETVASLTADLPRAGV